MARFLARIAGFLVAAILAAQSTDPIAEGMKALEARNYDQAIALFSKAVAANPTDYSAHFNLALAYSLSGQDALAVPEYRRTLEIKPGIFQAELNLGQSLFNTKAFADAAQAYARALEINANSAPAELGLARSLAHTDKLDES